MVPIMIASEGIVGKDDTPTTPVKAAVMLSAEEWAVQQYAQVDLGDKRRNQQALKMAAKMAAHPEVSLPEQMGSRSELDASYRLLNNGRVSMEMLTAAHRQQTLAAAGQFAVVLMAEDTTELDYTAHRRKKGLGPVGNERGQGVLLHSTLAVVPEGRQVLGLAHAQVVVREPIAKPNRHRRHTPEGQVWEVSARRVGNPPPGVLWVHVSDRESDIFAYMATCIDAGKHFLVRAYQNRVLVGDGKVTPAESGAVGKLLDYARSLPARAEGGYRVEVPAYKGQRGRVASVVLQWATVQVGSGSHTPPALRHHAPISVWVLRVWEAKPPEGAEAVEWILLSSLPITTVTEAHRAVGWYGCRWLCEDYHQCLKTGCQVERSQLDDGADIQRLLGFSCLIAVRLLQLRQVARLTPELMAVAVVDPLMVEMLTLCRPKLRPTLTIGEFWHAVAGLGGHLGRGGDGPPGWRTLWRGWRKLSDLTEGARLFKESVS